MQPLDRIRAGGHEEEREKAVQHTGDPSTDHAKSEATCPRKMLEVSFADRGRMLGEGAQ